MSASYYVYDRDIDNFFYYRNIEIISNPDETFSMIPFTQEQYSLFDWFVSTLRHDIPIHIYPVKILHNKPLPGGYLHLTKEAVYLKSDFFILVNALPVIRNLFERQVAKGNFSDAIR